MSLESSVRISTQEYDSVQRSIKKVKDRTELDLNQRNEINEEHRWYTEEGESSKEDKPFDTCPIIAVSKDEFDEWCKPWKAALIVKVLRKRVHLGFMEQRLSRDWIKKEEEDYNHALLGGPWMVARHYLIVQHWKPFFLSNENTVTKIAAWICIPNLSVELYNHKFLWRVGLTIESMLKVDRATSIHSRGRFVRICVKIGLSKKLVPRISVMGYTFNIEYECLHLICFEWEKYGHKSDQCHEVVAGENVQPGVADLNDSKEKAVNQDVDIN
ncbi:uncharacterized protein LOC107482143 [Arachis duranensis]|uniref:Uncharacterized protein LOC107482143 n=1 Tax=Arachis duranensis TaxID=130453 RepID=A0A6P4CXA3_ARADU|nr:uncharacterized protein LOC107482143 [Arachis duranensis]